MRSMMVREEGWRQDTLLPIGWLFKAEGEGGERLSYLAALEVLAPKGATFDTNNAACDYIRASSNYTEQDAVSCEEFQLRRGSRKRRLPGEEAEGKMRREGKVRREATSSTPW